MYCLLISFRSLHLGQDGPKIEKASETTNAPTQTGRGVKNYGLLIHRSYLVLLRGPSGRILNLQPLTR
ncbi:hypothetical protein DDK00_15535 [Mycobacteroides abscessus]|nr:hypothetical protein B9M85_20090 [Mycobacteroides abscessus]RTZ42932.1 hypothetical protein CJN95_024155 [Mycobacteroides abscessus subsp. abscessus]OTR27553.1 hypothetical protein B9M79_20170 [Mycobacteroides abscessus]PVA29382.1 hypothetical protein DDJ36_17390 [Mycobacteroides abscessus]PVA41933.1 hypothetical protein DDJ48_21295 [Mycobacteroides abscessus]